MIDIKSLRLGNLILDHTGDIMEVAYIGDTIGLKNALGGTNKYQKDPLISGDIDKLNGVPLTEEMLLKCGFELSGVVQNIGYFRLIHEDGGKLFFYPHPMLKIEVKYLHQLQNLYYSNTGKELNTSGL